MQYYKRVPLLHVDVPGDGERSRLNETELLVIIIRVYREIIISRTHECDETAAVSHNNNNNKHGQSRVVCVCVCVCVRRSHVLHGIR